jgi:hypothetical protein
MNRLLAILVLLFLVAGVHAQTDKDRAAWAASILETSKQSSVEEKYRILSFDFGPLWTRLDDNPSVLGYIGNNYQRLRVVILIATKQPGQPDTYNVTGKTMVKNVVRSFTGTMKITKTASTSGADLGEEYKSEQVKESGVVFGEYHFAEDAKLTSTGKFDGAFFTDWIVDKDGRLQYDEVLMGADGYRNNQFAGTWTSYRTKASKPASWGDSRIPVSGGLDMGAGEFLPDEKYVRNGWQGYRDAYGIKQDQRALAEERRQWWK